MPFVAGETVGSYRLMEQLGQGGMASVFKAYHASLDRYVAIKVLHIAFNEDQSFLGRFKREARVVARLEHPNIVPIYDFSEYENRPYLVMKYIEGETLKACLERGPMSTPEILTVVDAVGAALAYAHRQGVLHRDVKPSNVLLAKDGQIYLADFGLARIVQSGESSLTADRLVGTPQYISPEQALSKADLDARTDVYSMGVMLYELLVGRVPFNADTPFAIIHDHIYTPLPLPRTVNPNLSEAVERVLLKALSKERDDRFADVSAFAAAMRTALTHGALPDSLPGTLPATVFTNPPSYEPGIAAASFSPSEAVIPVESNPLPPYMEIYPTSSSMPEIIVPNHTPPGGQAAHPSSPKSGGFRLKYVWIGLGGLAAVLILVIALGVVRDNGQQRSLNATQTAQVRVTRTPDPVVVRARADLTAALENWKRGDLAGATARLVSAMKTTGDDAAFTKETFEYLQQNEAWLLAGVLIFSQDAPKPVQGMLTQRDRVQDIHQALYMCASDPLAGEFLKKNSDKILFFRVAPIRYELKFGNAAKAKQDLGVILGSAEQLKLYPEARLLEVEWFQKVEPARARSKLNEVLKDKETLPEWVKLFALDLDKKIAVTAQPYWAGAFESLPSGALR